MESGKLQVLRSTERGRAESRGRPQSQGFRGLTPISGHEAEPIFRANSPRARTSATFLTFSSYTFARESISFHGVGVSSGVEPGRERTLDAAIFLPNAFVVRRRRRGEPGGGARLVGGVFRTLKFPVLTIFYATHRVAVLCSCSTS